MREEEGCGSNKCDEEETILTCVSIPGLPYLFVAHDRTGFFEKDRCHLETVIARVIKENMFAQQQS